MAKNVKLKQTPPTVSSKVFAIKYPLLWLIAVVLLVYLPTLQLGFTELDDTIFIKELHDFNEDLSNVFASFNRGVFDATKDTYYRPMFLISMILNYQVSGENIAGYHFVNLLLHLAAVLLLFRVFGKLGIKELHAFLLTLLFAVHPVLTQAVAWIPGRNDTLMAVFVLPFIIFSINYANEKKPKDLILSAIFLLLAVFTKETAILAPVACFTLLVMVLKKDWKEKNLLLLYMAWVAVGIVYLAVRSGATLKESAMVPTQMLHDFFYRTPLIIQYIGKIFLPFNLSVFPILQDTVYYLGLVAVLFLAVIIYLSAQKNWRNIIAGFVVFLLFLLPVLFVPNSLNEQTFEHRLYLPIIGILLILPETILFHNKLSDATRTAVFAGIALVFAFINHHHQDNFKSPISFWEQAYVTSPHSAYATMMYAARIADKQHSYELMRKAYQLNPEEKYLNYYYGVMLQQQDSLLQSEPYLLKEKKISDYYECDFYLAKVAYTKKEVPQAISYLQSYLKRDSLNPMANNNLLLMLMETSQKANAEKQVKAMQRRGLPVPPITQQQIRNMP